MVAYQVEKSIAIVKLFYPTWRIVAKDASKVGYNILRRVLEVQPDKV